MVGARVRNKDASRVDDTARFSAFVDERVDRVSGFELIGDRIRFGFVVGETRNERHESTHVGCSVLLRGKRWARSLTSWLMAQGWARQPQWPQTLRMQLELANWAT
jgi:hypothetical protein